MNSRKKPSASKVIGVAPAGPDHQVLTIKGGKGTYRREPCPGCPWKVENTGNFPASAFAHSARTAYDMAQNVFGCHESGKDKPATCAGFLLNGSHHNLAVRISLSAGTIKQDVSDGGAELHANYRAMAIANGVDPDDPVLAPCRD